MQEEEVSSHDFFLSSQFLRQRTDRHLRCPETLFISHENANFLFSVFRVGQGETQTPKIIWCCRANFAFLPALKIGTLRGKWTSEWVFKTSLFVRLALYLLNQQQTCFFFDCFSTMPNRNCKETLDLERRTVQKITFCSMVGNLFSLKFSLSLFLSQ